MGKLVRKTILVDPEQLRQLAKHLGTSEAEAVRRAVDAVLHEHEVMAAAAAIRKRGGLDDVFGRTRAQ